MAAMLALFPLPAMTGTVKVLPLQHGRCHLELLVLEDRRHGCQGPVDDLLHREFLVPPGQ
ncbi:MAG: hypothetical protein OEW15_01180 [Nitrospirota bacterium]|nr:hypothetical protein [Nitrospirota bacterium]